MPYILQVGYKGEPNTNSHVVGLLSNIELAATRPFWLAGRSLDRKLTPPGRGLPEAPPSKTRSFLGVDSPFLSAIVRF